MIDNDSATSDLLFVLEEKKKSKEEEKDQEKEIAKEVEKETSVPGNYIEVKLSSLGKLSFPKRIHVRNYTFEEALELSELTEENEKSTIIEVLNSLIWEDIDASLLHEQEAIEILLNIYSRWWGSKIEGFRYFVNEDLEGEEKNNPENISIAEIPIGSINTIEIKKEVKEPFTLENDGFSVSFMLPRMQTSIIAKRFVNSKYAEEENRFGPLKRKIKLGQDYDYNEYDDYVEYMRERGKDYLRAYQAQLIHSVNGVKVSSFSEALEYLSKIDLSMWAEYNSIVEKYFEFGVSEEVKFQCSVNHTPITRRFQFRSMVFLPSVESKDTTRYTLSFG